MFEYNVSIIQTELENMQNICSDSSEILDDIKNVGLQIGGYWSGEAADSFKTKYAEMANAFDSFKETLESAIKYVNSTIENSTNIEETNLELVEEMF